MELTTGSIQEMYDKFKGLLADDALFYGMLIVLVALASFGLGRWSAVISSPKASLLPASIAFSASSTLETHVNEAGLTGTSSSMSSSSTAGIQTYVGSKNGTKYHLLTCPGAQQIKEENKIYFATKEEAQRAGYTPAANCPGL